MLRDILHEDEMTVQGMDVSPISPLPIQWKLDKREGPFRIRKILRRNFNVADYSDCVRETAADARQLQGEGEAGYLSPLVALVLSQSVTHAVKFLATGVLFLKRKQVVSSSVGMSNWRAGLYRVVKSSTEMQRAPW